MKARMSLCVSICTMAFAYAGAALANPPTALQRVYFDNDGHIIGESLRYCDAQQSHWGVASVSATNYVQANYGCGVTESTTISYGHGAPDEIRRTFCSLPGITVCTQSLPWPSYDYVVGPITSTLYSD